jgi:hypothetical protein
VATDVALTMINQVENPAARLLAFVNKALSVTGNLKAMEGWAKVLELEPDNFIGIFEGMTDTIQLTIQTREAISSLPDGYDKVLLFAPINKILFAINATNLQGYWQTITNNFDLITITSLQFCSTILAQHMNEASLSDDKIKFWLQEIDDLLDSINTSEVPEQLKIFFVEHLEMLRLALLHYWIFGTVGVQSSVERTIGALCLKNSQISTIKHKPFVKRVLDLFMDLANVITVAQGAQALSEGIQLLLASSL